MVCVSARKENTHPGLDPDIVQDRLLQPRHEEVRAFHGRLLLARITTHTYLLLHTRETVKEHRAVATRHVVQARLHRNGTQTQGDCVASASVPACKYVPANLERKLDAAFAILDRTCQETLEMLDSAVSNLASDCSDGFAPGLVSLHIAATHSGSRTCHDRADAQTRPGGEADLARKGPVPKARRRHGGGGAPAYSIKHNRP